MSGAASLARLLHSKALLMIGVYFDESGTHANSAVFTLAGYAFTEKRLCGFEVDWRAVLKRFQLSHFHMKDYVAQQREFAGWDDEKRIDLMKQLTAIVRRWALIGAAVGVDAKAYDEAIGVRLGQNATNYRQPYILCLQECMKIIGTRFAHRLPPDERIACVFDENSAITGVAFRHYGRVKNAVKWGQMFGPLAFGSDKDITPLQAADLLAYETRKEMVERLEGSARPSRRSYQQLMQPNVYFYYLTHALLHGLADEFIADARRDGLLPNDAT